VIFPRVFVGLCVQSPDGTAQCQCSPGWIGAICHILDNPCIKYPCPDGTICVDLSTVYRPAVYDCICPDGFTGESLVGLSLHSYKGDPPTSHLDG